MLDTSSIDGFRSALGNLLEREPLNGAIEDVENDAESKDGALHNCGWTLQLGDAVPKEDDSGQSDREEGCLQGEPYLAGRVEEKKT